MRNVATPLGAEYFHAGITGFIHHFIFKFTEAISFVVNCKTQKEVDHYWEKLSEGGDEKARQCGWLKDKYGLSWQIVPSVLTKLLQDKNAGKAKRVMGAILQMKKIDIEDLKKAYKG